MDRRSLAVLAAFTMLFGGAATAQDKQTPIPPAPEKVEAPKAIPGVTPTDSLPIDPKTYVIGAEDVLYIRVFHDNDFTGPAAVRPDGKITLPLIGDVQAEGLTPERLAAQLKQAISTYIVKPDVTVAISQVNSKKYYVVGEANRPGTFPLVVATSIFEALNMSGGFREFANKKDVVILRKDGTRLHFNYKDYIKGKKQDKNIQIENGDTILIR